MAWRVDPTTGDYDLQGDRFAREDGLTTEVYLRLMTQRGTRLADPAFGSRLHEIERYKSAAAAQRDLPDIVREALEPMEIAGLIVAIDVTVEMKGRGLVGALIEVHDSGRRPYQFEVFAELAA
jgi:phage gp46-like protein